MNFLQNCRQQKSLKQNIRQPKFKTKQNIYNIENIQRRIPSPVTNQTMFSQLTFQVCHYEMQIHKTKGCLLSIADENGFD